jgi:dTDP-4-amino-4,6-dideoxy-D-galactose acyltransferase
VTTGRLEALAWDSEHFGRPVERTGPGDWPEPALRAALVEARERGVAWVYHLRPPDDPLGPELLAELGGRRVCTQARFAKELGPAAAPPSPPRGFRIGIWRGAPADPDLRALALAAGEHSRFHVDPRIPEERWRALYEQWIENSVRGELADRVFVASATDDDRAIGLVTLAFRREGFGEYGLVAVGERARRRGVASALLARAEHETRAAGLSRAEVGTQRENEPACRFYTSRGYRTIRLEDAYHFHLETRRA